jgi:uncharacterized protein (DUF58 family)
MRWSTTSSPKPGSAEPLFDEGLRWALKGLALPRRRSRAALEGAHVGTRGGRGEDFFQHRAYVAGEDLRTVDFRASARSGHLLVKELHRPLHQPLVVALDLSASLGLFGKRRCALQLGAAAAVLGLRRGDPLTVLVLEGARLVLAGRLLTASHPTLAVEALLSALPASGRGDLALALSAPFPVPLAGAHLLLVSDLYGEVDRMARALGSLSAQAGALSVLQVLAPQERQLPSGLEQLRDAESDEETQLGPDEVRAYGDRVETWRARLKSAVRGAAGEWLDVDASTPVGLTMRAWLG